MTQHNAWGRIAAALAAVSTAVAACAIQDIGSDTSGSGAGTTGSTGFSESTGFSGSTGAEMVSVDSACDAYAAALCSRWSRCIPFVINAVFGDESTCQARAVIDCRDAPMAPGSLQSPDTIAACADASHATECADIFNNRGPEICTYAGERELDAACTYDSQCQSGVCLRPTDGSSLCGTCGEPGTAGVSCFESADCIPGLICFEKLCVIPKASGEPCDAAGPPCEVGLQCIGGACNLPRQLDEPCDAAQPCDLIQGLYCSAGGKCTPVAYADTGQACGDVGGAPTVCMFSGVCVEGKCVAPADDGAACAAGGPGCVWPSVCFNGTCTLLSSAQCP